jgi:hypothetical protein
MPENTFGLFVNILLSELPYLLIWLAGLILAIVCWSRYPRPARLTTLAIGMMFLATVLFCYLCSQLISRQWPNSRTWIQILAWGLNIVRALGYGLLFWAIFSSRQTFSPRRFDQGDEPDETDAEDVERPDSADPRIRKRPSERGN